MTQDGRWMSLTASCCLGRPRRASGCDVLRHIWPRVGRRRPAGHDANAPTWCGNVLARGLLRREQTRCHPPVELERGSTLHGVAREVCWGVPRRVPPGFTFRVFPVPPCQVLGTAAFFYWLFLQYYASALG